MLTITKDMILKYDKPGPRYTSYPTAPEWTNEMTNLVYQEKLQQFNLSSRTLSVYIHIPFCQSLCYFCACNVAIRQQDARHGDEYLNYLLKEISLVRKSLTRKPLVRQFHLGGGTPTFLSEAQLERLMSCIKENFELDEDGEISIEIDPRTIDRSKVAKLKQLGFNRVSMGIQDFDAEVQKNVNRIQSFEMVEDFHSWCRELKFKSVNYDLIYGLPGQTKASFNETIEKVLRLRPDRIALYSFAYVPWLKKHQNQFHPKDLPDNDEKLDIFLHSRQLLAKEGYQAIAMDHFALETDEMAKAFNQGTLYRNFMGYTVKPADEFMGLGVSSIGFLEHAFIQNFKTLPEYYEALSRNELPVERGKDLSLDDEIRQWTINRFMCRFEVNKSEFNQKFQCAFDDYFKKELSHVYHCVEENLLSLQADTIIVTDLGKIFIRNICMGFDWYLRQSKSPQRFSKTI